MQQVTSPRPFVEHVLRNAAVLDGRWAGITFDRTVPGTSDPVSIFAVRAMILLAEGAAGLRHADGATPALVATPRGERRPETVSYRTRDHAIVGTSIINQPPLAAVPLAAALLAADAAPALADAHLALLDGLAAGLDQAALDDLAMHAGAALAAALESDGDLAALAWFSGARAENAGEIDEASDPAALPIDALFSDAAALRAYRAGTPGDFDLLRARSVRLGEAPVDLDPAAFVGPQRERAVRFMREGKHVLFHGPTGTGKTYLWNLAMSEIDPAFDPDDYPYVVNCSAGIEDQDFIGAIIPQGADRVWIDGPLIRAMKEGRRLRVEEINRMPAPMLNVLLAALDYGRIAVTRHTGELVVAAPGFAVDATANIGNEYTGTEALDPAIMRRFQRKVEFDFLPADQELLLLRSRHPALDREDGETLVRIAGAIREAYEYGGTDLDVDLYVSPAGLIESAGLVAEGMPIPEAIEVTWLADVARSRAKRERVRQMIDQNLRDRTGGRRSRRRAA